MRAARPLVLLASLLLLVAACSSAAASPAAVGGGAPSPAGTIVSTATSTKFGAVLTGPTGMTLYTYAGDTPTASTCSGACATAWPPLGTTGQPIPATDVTGKLGTLVRPDGSTQVTYDGLPLYYWQGDTKAGDVTGDGVEGFSVAKVARSGAAPKATPAAPAPTSGVNYSY